MIQTTCPICGMTMIKAEGGLLCPCCGEKEACQVQQETAKKENSKLKRTPYYFKKADWNEEESEEKTTEELKEKSLAGSLKDFFNRGTVRCFLIRLVIPAMIGAGAAIFVEMNGGNKEEKVPDYEAVTSQAPTEMPADGMLRRREVPESEFFQELVAQLFEKDYAKVEPEEYEKVRSICLQKEETGETTVICGMTDGTEMMFTLAELEKDYMDLQCFINLEAVDIGEDSLDYWNLHFLENINSIGSGTSLLMLHMVVSDPLAITELKIYGTVSLLELDYLSTYENLKILSFDVHESADLSVLEELPQLVEVYINGVLQE